MTKHTTSRSKMAGVLVSPELKSRSSGLFTISSDAQSITCKSCGHVSHDPDHVRQRFCPNCLTFHEDHTLMQRLEEGLRAQLSPSPADWKRLQEAA